MKKEINEQFKDTLFSEEDIEYVSEKVKENLALLQDNNNFLERQDNITAFEDYISNCNNEIKKLFRQYENAYFDNVEEQNCLAYYIGIKRGFELGNISKKQSTE